MPLPLVLERIVCRQATLAAITDCAPAGAEVADRPVLLMLHGAYRTGRCFLDGLAPYREWADVLIPDLPGSGDSEPPLEAGIAALADEIVSLVRRRVPGRRLLVLGESIGGLVGLACCDGRLPVAALVLLDPPLSMAKQWVIQINVDRVPEPARDWFFRESAQSMFGVDCATGEVRERVYYAPFAGLSVPCLIVRGDSPLFPIRSPQWVPNCFDDVDELIVRTLSPACRIERLSECGHLVFIDGEMRCHDLIRAFVADAVDV
jgi:pimeloyl-ACP methyl ester carboxylesterase